MRTLSLRARLTLWYMVALVVVLALFGADVLVIQQRLGLRRADRELDSIHATLTTILGEELKELDTPALAATEARDAIASLGGAIAILDAQGNPLALGLDRLSLADMTPRGVTAPAAWTIQGGSGEWRVHAKPETFGSMRFMLVVGRPLIGRASCRERVYDDV